MTEFFAENNSCGQAILQLVSRGNAIIAELLRLKDYIPNVYRMDTKQIIQKYGEILLDFRYFKIAEVQEQKIENNEELRDLDEEFRDNHLEIITRYYLAFESVHTYITDLNHFLDELEEGIYIHQSLQTISADVEGRQLLCESLYLYGVMLLVLDTHIDGITRERLLVSYYRYTPQRRDTQSAIDEVCKLLRDTGYSLTKKPQNYPEDYFRRISIRSIFIDIVIGRLRSDDIYNQLSVYPLSRHRSTALSTQAAMLYVCLFFSTNILHSQAAIMREVVDKYFPDNWVISIYMGYTVNLVETWDAFKAAKLALNNTLENINIKNCANSFGSGTLELLKSSGHLLKEGTITSENLLSDIAKITNTLRDCNVVVRWLMLHAVLKPEKIDKNKRCKQLRELVITESKYNPGLVFKLLLNTAQLELITKDILKDLLTEKENKWAELKTECSSYLMELSEVFSGRKPLTRVEKNPNLQKWFTEISKEVDSLELDNMSARKIIQLIQALEEVQEFHQLESNMQIIQFLTETRKHLHHMVRTMNIKEDTLITIQIIGDLSYAWELIDSYTSIMQTGIKKEPTLVIKLRAVFLKLASALEIPLLRINQSHSDDLMSVSQYYSNELEIYVRKVLQIIPEMMFEKMARIIEIQTSVLKEVPTRLDKDKLREYAQLNERFEFAELTHSISLYSEGMRMMKSTLVGVVCLDPKQLLEDGIRQELVKHISKALHIGLIFNVRPKSDELEQNLKILSKIMDAYKRSFEYIQDYVNINGLKIWQEEVTRIINFNVEQECNGFLRNKVHAWESSFQSRYVPIPEYPQTDISVNFIGRLAREVIRLTDAKNCTYIEQTSSWYDLKTHKPVVNRETFNLMSSAIEKTGLVGLDRLFSFMVITKLQKVIKFLQNKDTKDGSWPNIISSIHQELKSFEAVSNVSKFYQNCIARTTKYWGVLLDDILNIGQLQLFRNLIAFHLNTLCKFNARNLESSLNTLNRSLLNDMLSENSDNYPSENCLAILSPYFDWAGMNNPFNKIYVTVQFNEQYVTTLFIFVISHLQKLFLLRSSLALAKRGQEQVDGVSFALGIHSIFKQFNPNLNQTFMEQISHFIMYTTRQSISTKNSEIPLDAVAALRFIETYVNYSKSSDECFKNSFPEELYHLLNSMLLL